MNIEDLEKRINENADKLDKLTEKIEHNLDNINKNREQINHNTGALDLLHTINANSNRYFTMWLITFVTFLIIMIVLVGYIFYLKNDIGTIETSNDSIEIQDVESIDNSHIKIGDDIWEKSQ